MNLLTCDVLRGRIVEFECKTGFCIKGLVEDIDGTTIRIADATIRPPKEYLTNIPLVEISADEVEGFSF